MIQTIVDPFIFLRASNLALSEEPEFARLRHALPRGEQGDDAFRILAQQADKLVREFGTSNRVCVRDVSIAPHLNPAPLRLVLDFRGYPQVFVGMNPHFRGEFGLLNSETFFGGDRPVSCWIRRERMNWRERYVGDAPTLYFFLRSVFGKTYDRLNQGELIEFYSRYRRSIGTNPQNLAEFRYRGKQSDVNTWLKTCERECQIPQEAINLYAT